MLQLCIQKLNNMNEKKNRFHYLKNSLQLSQVDTDQHNVTVKSRVARIFYSRMRERIYTTRRLVKFL